MYQGTRHIRIGWVIAVLLAMGPIYGASAQNVDIEGRVVLDAANTSLVQSGGGGYQAVTSNPATRSSESNPKSILVWLESTDSEPVTPPENTSMPVLDQVDKQFKPRLMAVRVGEEVRIRNSDPIYHNVFSLSRTKRFDVGRRPPGDYEQVQFDEPGVVDVFCDIHSDMHAVIVVLPKRTLDWKKLKESGAFRFENVPQGNYKLHFYALGDLRRSIDIRAVDMKKVTLETIRLGS